MRRQRQQRRQDNGLEQQQQHQQQDDDPMVINDDVGRMAEEHAERLQMAATVLVDRLFEYHHRNHRCNVSLQQQQQQHYSSSSSVNDNDERRRRRPPPYGHGGLTLPASAVGWLTTQLSYSINDNNNVAMAAHAQAYGALWMGSAVQHRLSLLQKAVLTQLTHVRITLDEWPPPPVVATSTTTNSTPSRRRRRRQEHGDDNLVGHEIINLNNDDMSSVHSTITMEEDGIDNDDVLSVSSRTAHSVPPRRPSLQEFLFWYHKLQQSPTIDIRLLFPNIQVLWLDQIPPEWIVLHQDNDPASISSLPSLELLIMERACIYNVTECLFSDSINNSSSSSSTTRDENALSSCCARQSSSSLLLRTNNTTTTFPKLTHLKLSSCAIGELSGLRGSGSSQEEKVRYDDENDNNTDDDDNNAYNGHLFDVHVAAEDNNDDLLDPTTATSGSAAANGAGIVGGGPAKQQQRTTARMGTVTTPPPLSRLTNLVSLSLSHNEIRSPQTALAGLASLPRLQRLDLSYNFLTTMRGAHTMLGNIKVLILTGNRLETVQGLDRLYSLESLHLDRNNLRDVASVAGLAKLPQLQSLKLLGNPLANYAPRRYRVEVLNLFQQERFVVGLASAQHPVTYHRLLLDALPILDGKPASKTELIGLRGFAFSHLLANTSNGSNTRSTLSERDVVVPPERQDTSDKEASALSTLEDGSDEGHRCLAPTPVCLTGRPKRVARRGKSRRIVIEEGLPRNHVELNRSSIQDATERRALPKGDSDITKSVRFSLTDLVATLPRLLPPDIENDGSVELDIIDNGTDGVELSNGEITNEIAQQTSGSSAPPLDDTDAGVSVSLQRQTMPDQANGLSFITLSPVLKDGSVQVNGITSDTEVALSTVDVESQTNPRSPSHKDEEGPQTNSDYDNEDDSRSGYVPEDRVKLPTGERCETSKQNGGPPTDSVQYQTRLQLMECPDVSSTDVDLSERADIVETMIPQVPEVVFPDYVWEEDENSVLSSVKTDTVDTSSQSKYKEAEEESIYDGLDHLKGLPVLTNLELYFRCFVFRVSVADSQPYPDEPQSEKEKLKLLLDLAPRIQLRPVDWRALESAARSLSMMELYSITERFDGVWREEALACGKLAAKRLAPHRKPKRGFHGDVLFSNGKLAKTCECRRLIVCTSDAAIYLVSDYDAVSRHQLSKAGKRRFPMPIPEESLFQNAPWPHALARHHILTLDRITIGFGFQRLSLHFRPEHASGGRNGSEDFTYILITCNKMKTVNLLQHFQSLAKDFASRPSNQTATNDLTIDNDDKQVLDALAEAVAPSTVGMVLHYQIVQQRWQHGDRGTVRRACIVTDTHLYLLEEDYVGDGSESFEPGARELGDVCFKLVDDSSVEQVSEARVGLDDPNSVTVVIKPLSRLQRYHRWRLVCRDREGAERLVEDIRKVMTEESFG